MPDPGTDPLNDSPLLGLASNEELLYELIVRFKMSTYDPYMVLRALILAEMLGGLDASTREYRTVDHA